MKKKLSHTVLYTLIYRIEHGGVRGFLYYVVQRERDETRETRTLQVYNMLPATFKSRLMTALT